VYDTQGETAKGKTPMWHQ